MRSRAPSPQKQSPTRPCAVCSLCCCAVCKPGFGGAACDVCGGPNPTYGPGTRPIGTECIKCPSIAGGGTAGFDFMDPKGANQFYMPRIIAAIAATQATECISEFTQVGDNAWSLDVQVGSLGCCASVLDWLSPWMDADQCGKPAQVDLLSLQAVVGCVSCGCLFA